MSSATEHLPRLLALVPWLLAHPDTPIEAAAAEFGVTPDQLRADLNLIWMCGLPGQGPGDLIDVYITADRVTLANADTIAAPLRLSATETLAVVAALRALSALPGIADVDAVERALSKLEASAGSAAAAADQVQAASGDVISDPEDPEIAATVRRALTAGRRLHIDYWVPARDELTHRDVDPLRIRTAGAATYLIAWCRLVEDVRTFRLDRVHSARMLDQPCEPHPEATQDEPDSALFTPSAGDRLVRIELEPPGRWLIDYYPVESVDERPDGRAVVTLRARDDEWVVRLALSVAGAGRLLEPSDLVDRAQRAAEQALSAYAAT